MNFGYRNLARATILVPLLIMVLVGCSKDPAEKRAKHMERGDAYLRQAELASAGGSILVPVNCGQQTYDVIDITDSRAGLNMAKRRVLGFVLVYSPRRGEYRQRLYLGAV